MHSKITFVCFWFFLLSNSLSSLTLHNPSAHDCEIIIFVDDKNSHRLDLRAETQYSFDGDFAHEEETQAKTKFTIKVRFPELQKNFMHYDNVEANGEFYVFPVFSTIESDQNKSITYYLGLAASSSAGAMLGTVQGASMGAYAGTMIARQIASQMNPFLQLFFKPIIETSCCAVGVTSGTVFGLITGTIILGLAFKVVWGAANAMIDYRSSTKQESTSLYDDWVITCGEGDAMIDSF